mgnify:CR=1 FL=1
MSYEYDFMDNVTYGTDDINKIRGSLMSKGVIPETANSCKVVANGTGQIKILTGEAVFANGVRIEITADETLSYTSGSTNYVYLEYSSTLNKCEPKVSTSAPASDRIKLATISSTGAITDTREVSNLKVPMGVNSFEEVTVSIENFKFASSKPNTWELAKEVSIRSSGYKNFYAKRGDLWTVNGTIGTDSGSFAFSRNSLSDPWTGWSYSVIHTYSVNVGGVPTTANLMIKFTISSQKLQVWLLRNYTELTAEINQNFVIKLM